MIEFLKEVYYVSWADLRFMLYCGARARGNHEALSATFLTILIVFRRLVLNY